MRIVRFFLPGHSDRPVGGYKVVYEYANYLVRQPGVRVEIHESFQFLLSPLEKAGFKELLTVFVQHAASCVAVRLKGPWFNLDSKIAVHRWLGLPHIHATPGDVWIATACQTAPFVAKRSKATDGHGLYFIQHYEDWSAPEEFVRQTWRLGLTNVVIAPWLMNKAEELGVSATLVPNAIDPGVFSAGPPIDSRPKSVLAMISAAPFKRLDLVIEAFAHIHEADPSIRLTTFGTIPRPSMLPDYVEHHHDPSQEELQGLYHSCRVYLTASDAEGWHLPPAEALLSGSSLVSTDIGGVRAYAGEVALFSPPGDAESLARNAVYLCSNAGDAQSRVDAGRNSLLSFTPEDAARAFFDVCLSA